MWKGQRKGNGLSGGDGLRHSPSAWSVSKTSRPNVPPGFSFLPEPDLWPPWRPEKTEREFHLKISWLPKLTRHLLKIVFFCRGLSRMMLVTITWAQQAKFFLLLCSCLKRTHITWKAATVTVNIINYVVKRLNGNKWKHYYYHCVSVVTLWFNMFFRDSQAAWKYWFLCVRRSVSSSFRFYSMFSPYCCIICTVK